MPKINYINKDFKGQRESLINFAKTYYPSTYTDFNPASPGMMFIDMAAYVGDVLSYYIDDTFKETLLSSAERWENVIDISQAMGYKPNVSHTSNANIDVFMVVPSIYSADGDAGDNRSPAWDYALTIKPGMVLQSSTNSDIYFRTDDYVIFKNSGSYEEGVDLMVYSYDDDDLPYNYLLKQTVSSTSGTEKVVTMSVPENPKKFQKIQLDDTDIIKILSVTDSDGNNWYEVPYLAQDTIFTDELNTVDPDVGNINETQYLLRLKKVQKRYTTKINKNYKTELHFGSGVSVDDDEEIIPNPDLVGSSLKTGKNGIDNNIDPSNFLYTKTYGEVPYNTTLTITYLRGGGIKSNIPAKDITTVSSIDYETYSSTLNATYINEVKDSIAVNNPSPATGGKGRDSIEEIRQSAIANFASQKRAVTKEDYIIRAYSMSAKYGSIAKAYITQDMQLNRILQPEPNPLALDLYVLSYDSEKHLTTSNAATKENLKTYINEYRILTDAINILDAYIINIGVKFDIVTTSNYNKNEVILRCIDEIYEYFNIDKWQINQPIMINDIYNLLFTVKGVQNVNKIEIENKWDSADDYSGHSYDIAAATSNGIIYPSLDPSIFELKFKGDIKGKAR